MQEKDKKKKIPNTLKVAIEAQRKAQESMKAFMQPSQRIAEVMKQQLNSVEHLRKLASPTSHIAEMMEQIKQQQQVYANITNTFKQITAIPDYTSEIMHTIRSNYIGPIAEAISCCREAFNTARIIGNAVSEAIKPFREIQENITAELSKVDWHSVTESLSASVHDYKPEIAVQKEALVIDEEQFSQEQISQIVNDYLLDANSDRYVFRKNNKKNFWTSIPKRVVWVLLVIIVLYVQAGWQGLVKSGPLDLERFEKLVTSGRKNIVKHFSEWFTVQPFVNTEKLKVYLNPKRKSIKIAELKFLQEVKVLKFKKKKRWALIEWKDDSGETHQGWVLARYIYRKNIQKE